MNNIPSIFFGFYINNDIAYMIEDRTMQKALLKNILNRQFSINLQMSGEKKSKRLNEVLKSGKYVLVRNYEDSEAIDCFSYEFLTIESISAYFQKSDNWFERFKDYCVFEDIVLDTPFAINNTELKDYINFQLQQFMYLSFNNYELKKYPYIRLSKNLIQKRIKFFDVLKRFYPTYDEEILMLENQEMIFFKNKTAESGNLVRVFKKESDLFKKILEGG